MKNTSLIISTSMIAMIALSCKPLGNSSSDLQTVDNYAGTASIDYQCGLEADIPNVKQYEPRIKTNDENLKKSTLLALSAAPRKLRDFFFEQLNGQIRLDSAEAAKRCSSLDENSKKFASDSGREKRGDICIVTDKPDEKTTSYVILASEDGSLVRHGLLRIMSYLISEVAMPIIELDGANAAGTFLNSQMDMLSKMFLGELNGKANARNRDAIKTFAESNPKAFAHFVFAETLDSYYCTDESLKALRDQFNLTFRSFSEDAFVRVQTNQPKTTSYATALGPK